MIDISKMKALAEALRFIPAQTRLQAANAIDTLLSELEALIHDNGQLVKAASAEATLADQLRIELKAHADFRQSVLDPENQPSQHGTILLDTHEKEVSRLRAELESREADRRRLWLELEGVVIDTKQGYGFDEICLTTIKRVRDALAGRPPASEGEQK
ncbi:hypothetical protein [Burkholderia sp. B21-005]|uniref:hypothetical protein n=1 Tax=Burkholderia sp. B21-005 TaxID=2890406 RepID=UPI001E3FB658|nr:hypothetical protein [Burkholderia sp. B21-005]UEP43185.1 hypothetical protein LMA02_24235 [Burkholderia sp. B21-005]